MFSVKQYKGCVIKGRARICSTYEEAKIIVEEFKLHRGITEVVIEEEGRLVGRWGNRGPFGGWSYTPGPNRLFKQ